MDFLIVTTYDYHLPSNEPTVADNPSPLYKQSWDKENDQNVDFAINHWIETGFPASKILMVFSLFGKTWTLSSSKTTPPAPAFGPGPTGKYLVGDTIGFMSYNEICEVIKTQGWKKFRYPSQRTGPYAISPAGPNQTWVGFDDPAMAIVKSKYLVSKGLGGAAVWDIGLDDFRNQCQGGRYPMLKAINNALNSVKEV